MSGFSNFLFPALRVAARKEKGGSPEDARQGKINMMNVAEKTEKSKLMRLENSKFVTASPEKRAADWLESEIIKARGKITSQVADLTPALATALLNRNPDNRKVNDRAVTNYARDMANGAWQFNGEPIIVADNGKLNDGQHRCEAVIVSEVAIPVVLIIGVDRVTRNTLDQGRARTVADYLSMDGYANAPHLATAASLIWQYLAYGWLANAGMYRPTKSEVLNFIEEHKKSIEASVSFVHRKDAAVLGKSVLAFCHWAFWQKAGREAADKFILSLMEGAGLHSGHPVLYARNRLAYERGRARANEKAELIFRAWNSVRTGRDTVRALQINGGKLPKLES